MLVWLMAIGHASELLAGPFLQSATPTSVVVVWETDDETTGEAQFGPTSALGSASVGTTTTSSMGTTLHQATITADLPGGSLFYSVAGDGYETDPVSVDLIDDTTAARFVAMSDMQQDRAAPFAFQHVVENGVMATVTGPLHGLLIPGDLVANGYDHEDWTDDFFGQGAPLLSRVPLYSVLGNHELDDPLYYEYMVLPGAGQGIKAEGYWTHDVGRVRLIGFDSNTPGLYSAQLSWLEGLLAQTCTADVDFVIAQLHHPHRSELWTPGNNPFTGLVADALGTFSTACGIPSVHLFGHTHGYSRGAHPEHNHLMMNVASGGGALDRWGEQLQQNYPEYAVSTDDYGYVVIDTVLGDDPSLTAKRYSLGTPDAPIDNVLTDEVTIRTNNVAPTPPTALFPTGTVGPDCVELTAGTFSDDDGDAHAATHWQIDTSCGDFDDPLWERLEQSEDRFFKVDLANDLTIETVHHVAVDRALCWRVRYRDDALGWSDWSEATSFRVSDAVRSPNLIEDPDWSTEPIGTGQCGAPSPAEGAYSLGLGVCENQPDAADAYITGVGQYADDIDSGAWFVHLSAWFLSDPADSTILAVSFLATDGTVLGSTTGIGSTGSTWTEASEAVALPAGTRQLSMELERTGTASTASFVDGISVQVGPSSDVDCAVYVPPVDVPDDRAGCKCTNSGFTGWALPLLLLPFIARRRRS
ncbi:MAG: hypothetical protein ACJAZO_002852 [Myxococcota bacterium]|jgi:hypothetical protein